MTPYTNTLTVLRRSAQRFSQDPESWTQRAFARDDNGHDDTPMSHFATQWCMLGMVRRISGDMLPEEQAKRVVAFAISALYRVERPSYRDDVLTPIKCEEGSSTYYKEKYLISANDEVGMTADKVSSYLYAAASLAKRSNK